jgi:phenylalanyl-tRNA synthetase beta chain
MKFSLEWLKNLSQTKLNSKQLAELLSEHTTEAEVTHSKSFPGIIVADVTKVENHPNADRLRVVELTDGTTSYYPVVCGAKNFDVGARVALSLPGATIPHDQHDPEGKPFVLTKAKIRGIESQGMICSAKELGLDGDNGGILLLDENFTLGTQLVVGDEALEVSSFANRPDLYSYLGVAREIATLSDTELLEPKTVKLPKPDQKFNIKIENKKHCKHYSAVVLSNVTVAPSPAYIQKRLKASGLRPINNVVDITNYVMLLTAQPMHAFDAQKLGNSIIVRSAQPNEKLLTLDGVERTLPKETLVIADEEKALAVAGVIGGKGSAVSDDTNKIVLETANFDAASVRKTSRMLNIRTDASSRFEKSLPINFVHHALSMALELLAEHASAKIESYSWAGEKPEEPTIITTQSEQITGLLGMEVSSAEQKKILQKFGFTASGAAQLKVTVPYWRPDVTIWQDLAEEIIRFKGLNAAETHPPVSIFSSHLTEPLVNFKEQIADLMANMGLSEIYTYSFTSTEDNAALEVANPLNDEQKFLRTNILANMSKVAHLNARFFNSGMYFEIGDSYRRGVSGFSESLKLGILAYSKKDYQIADVNGAIVRLAEKFNCHAEFVQHADISADVLINGKAVGTVEVLMDTELKIVGASLDLKTFLHLTSQRQFTAIPRFPNKTLDTSIILDEKTTWSDVYKAAGKNPLLKDLILVDIYVGEGIESGKKSLTIRAIYQADDRTLTDQEAEAANGEIMAKISQKTGAKIRN